MPLKIKNAILCDSVRTEDNGKHILIGVYSGGIVFPKLPARVSFTYWIQLISPIQSGEVVFDIKIKAPGLKSSTTNEITLLVERKEELAVLVIVIPAINIIEEGELTLSIRVKGDRWTKVLSKKVSMNESTLLPG